MDLRGVKNLKGREGTLECVSPCEGGCIVRETQEQPLLNVFQ